MNRIERAVRALGDVVMAAFAIYVLWGQEWLLTRGGLAADIIGIALIVLAGIVIIYDAHDLLA